MPEATLKRWLNRGYGNEKVEKPIDKIEHGFLVPVANGFASHSRLLFIRVLSRPITGRKGHKSLGMLGSVGS